jgi:hypothetical protein
MEEHIVKIESTKDVTHNVRAFRIVKPPGYDLNPARLLKYPLIKKVERRKATLHSQV